MHYAAVLKIVGVLFAMFSISLLPPLAISYYTQDGAFTEFLTSFAIIFCLGFGVWFAARKNHDQLGPREGFLTVAAFWLTLATAGTLPFLLLHELNIGFTDAFFESMSGLTTTGATVLVGLDNMPISILYYRQQLQWLGGMGIIVLAVSVIPMLGIGGMQLYMAEMPGVMKNTKIAPRIKETAKALWYLYLGLTIVCAFCYWLAGMTAFDAITHSFSTVAIGGFSTHDNSIGYFNSDAIMLVAVVFMVISGVNFALHFRVWSKLRPKLYLMDTEFRVYLALIFVPAIIVCIVLVVSQEYGDTWTSVKHGVFQVVSIATTSGFTTADFSAWPLFLPAMLLAGSIIGGCTGSTAGGLKIMRVIMLFKQGRREILQLLHPDAILPIYMNDRPVQNQVINAVWGFFSLYIVSFVILSLVMQAFGNDLVTAYSTVTACLNNLGPALPSKIVAQSKTILAYLSGSKWVLAFTMLLGRLELLTLLVLCR